MNELDEITRRHTAFNSFHALISLSISSGYVPTLLIHGDIEKQALADAYDSWMSANGYSFRVFRGQLRYTPEQILSAIRHMKNAGEIFTRCKICGDVELQCEHDLKHILMYDASGKEVTLQ